ncbi:Ribosomal protein S18 acetylase RimI [Nocardioides terrae]|uniref:Ribosomal protein S18 acetylase RimI n=1 Tax=Nocardioides terrae TaxID=574651 RepID=A0A1I1DYL5_9ACTN|nr:GNAT family N-acetyltransferase [Nocardioides terrae]SFB80001.1 Ribosomal protein S18 acetylase RimI [Nocardioides terrae]
MPLSPTAAGLPAAWSARTPEISDLPALVALRRADKEPFTGSSVVDEARLESEIAGLRSWTRWQLVAVDPGGALRAWVMVHDRAAGRTMVHLYVDRSVEQAEEVAGALYAWAAERARAIARMRGLHGTQLDASPYAEDAVQRQWLTRSGFTQVRTWLQMSRPVEPGEDPPAPRPGVTVRRVRRHDNGLPVAADLWTVHQMLEESFADHFNSYRESFPEFMQRLREEPGHSWDKWWLAFVDDPEHPDQEPVPAGALVATAMPGGGNYVEYIGVNRHARGRGVAKALLGAVIRDAAERGEDRVGLEVDADSPTGADGLYRAMGWSTGVVTESWHRDISVS